MSSATKAVQAARFLGGMYRERARVLYWAHVRGDLFSRLNLPNQYTDPYPIYEEMRAKGSMLPTRLGNYSTTSHRLCNEVYGAGSLECPQRTEARISHSR